MSFTIFDISYNVITLVMVLYSRLLYFFEENVIYMCASFLCVCIRLIDSNFKYKPRRRTSNILEQFLGICIICLHKKSYMYMYKQ
jgi:hypothetical protein